MRFGGGKTPFTVLQGRPQWLSGKESTSSAGAAGDLGQYLGWEDALEKEMAVYSSILVWRIPQRSLVAKVP